MSPNSLVPKKKLGATGLSRYPLMITKNLESKNTGRLFIKILRGRSRSRGKNGKRNICSRWALIRSTTSNKRPRRKHNRGKNNEESRNEKANEATKRRRSTNQRANTIAKHQRIIINIKNIENNRNHKKLKNMVNILRSRRIRNKARTKLACRNMPNTLKIKGMLTNRYMQNINDVIQ